MVKWPLFFPDPPPSPTGSGDYSDWPYVSGRTPLATRPLPIGILSSRLPSQTHTTAERHCFHREFLSEEAVWTTVAEVIRHRSPPPGRPPPPSWGPKWPPFDGGPNVANPYRPVAGVASGEQLKFSGYTVQGQWHTGGPISDAVTTTVITVLDSTGRDLSLTWLGADRRCQRRRSQTFGPKPSNFVADAAVDHTGTFTVAGPVDRDP